jgi:dipeptidyl aminopeptidase/acylaminoacyl peptidase
MTRRPDIAVDDLLAVPGVLGSFRASLDFAGIDVSPDARRVVFPWNVTGTYELYLASMGDDSAPLQCTHTTPADRSMRPRFSPVGDQVAFLRDRDGDEMFDIWVLDLDGGGERRVTAVRANREAIEWTPDGAGLVYRAHVDGKLGIWHVDVATGDEGVVVQDARDPGSDHITPAVSHDGRFVAFHSAAAEDAANVVLQVASLEHPGSLWTLPTHPGSRARAVLPKWAPDGRALAFTTDLRGRFEVAIVPMRDGHQDGDVRYVAENDHDQTVLSWGSTGRILYRRSVDSAIHLRRVDPDSGADEAIVEDLGVCYSACEASDGSIAYVFTTPTCPQELYTRTANGVVLRRTDSLPPRLDPSALVMPQHVWYPGADGQPTPALLYRPNTERSSAPHDATERQLPPAVVWAHGGGTWQHLQNWDPIPQWLTLHGFVVLAPNARGSRGYGRAFREGNVGDWGGQDLVDHVKGADWLEREGIADGDRIGIYGSSGGGYMTSIALTRAPERWAAGMTSCGLVSLETFYRTTRADLRGMVEAYMGSPDKDPDLFRDRSPLTHIDNIEAPLLVLHGGTDPRVPVSEAELLVEALEARNAVYEYHVYPDEGHGFRNLRNQRDALERMVAWFGKHLDGGSVDAR